MNSNNFILKLNNLISCISAICLIILGLILMPGGIALISLGIVLIMLTIINSKYFKKQKEKFVEILSNNEHCLESGNQYKNIAQNIILNQQNDLEQKLICSNCPNVSITKKFPESWFADNVGFNRKMEGPLVELAKKVNLADGIDDKIVALENIIDYFYKIKSIYEQKSNYHAVYFSEMWMHCHNSNNPNFVYIERYEKELHNLRNNYDNIKAKELERKEELIDLDDKLLTFIKDNPGILQKEVYKNFSDLVSGEIQTKLYYWAKEEKIVRIKTGNTYSLYIK